MDIISSLNAMFPVGSATTQSGSRNQQQLLANQGQILKAMVLESLGENRFTLEIGSEKITARTEASLNIGQQLRLEVVQTSPQIELKIVSDTINQYLGKAVTLLGKNIDLGSLLTIVNQQAPSVAGTSLLSPISQSTLESLFSLQHTGLSEKDGGEMLKQFIDRLGLNMENLLAKGDTQQASRSLKAALLDVLQTFGKAENVTEASNKLLTTIEGFQLAQLQLGSQSVFILPLPFPFIEQGYLLVEDFSSDGESDSQQMTEARFSLHLSLTDFGNLQIDFLKNLEGLFIRFHTDSKEKSDFIQTYENELLESISGSSLVKVSYANDAHDPVGELLQQLVPASGSMFETKA